MMKKSALLIIDVQNDMFNEENPIYNGDKLLDNINYLITKARSSSTPIYYIQHNEPAGQPLEYGTKGWEINPQITPNDEDIRVQKKTPDSFFNTNLEEELRKQEIGHLVLTGIQSDLCVDTTCRRAFSLGYDVTLVSDTHSTWNSSELDASQIINHHNQVLRWFADVKQVTAIEFS
jgi:nicotinamidase-related amidase